MQSYNPCPWRFSLPKGSISPCSRSSGTCENCFVPTNLWSLEDVGFIYGTISRISRYTWIGRDWWSGDQHNEDAPGSAVKSPCCHWYLWYRHSGFVECHTLQVTECDFSNERLSVERGVWLAIVASASIVSLSSLSIRMTPVLSEVKMALVAFYGIQACTLSV